MTRAPRSASVAAAVTVLLGGLAACSDDSDGSETDAEPSPTATSDAWRTESFGDVELSVPGDWGYQTGDVAAALWCISDAAISAPVVIRPGVPIEQTCPGPENDDDPDPATLIEKAGAFVSLVFAASDPDAEEGTEGDRETVRSGAVLVRVQAPEDIRGRILSTLRQISTDANGCPVTDPISAQPARRPDNPVSVAELKSISSVAACRYAIPGGRFADVPEEEDVEGLDPEVDGEEDIPLDSEEDLVGDPEEELIDPELDPDADLRPTIAPVLPAGTPRSAPTLLSSVLLTGDAARDAVHGIADSKAGAGPDAEGGCEGADARTVRGTEQIVLRVTTATGVSQIYLRYGGCHNGFDDGVTERALSRIAVAPFVSGANLVPAYGEELLRILDDPAAPATSGEAEADAGEGEPSEDIPGETVEEDASSEPSALN